MQVANKAAGSQHSVVNSGHSAALPVVEQHCELDDASKQQAKLDGEASDTQENTVHQFGKNDELNMHKVSEAEELLIDQGSSLHKITSSKVFQQLMPIGNILSMIGNGLSFASALIPMPDKIKKAFVKSGEWSTNAFLHIIGLTNGLEQIERKNIFLATGYFLENVIALFVPQHQQYLARGFAVGPVGTSLGLFQASGRKIFSSVYEHAENIGESLKRAVHFATEDFWKNLRSSKTGLLSIIGGAGQMFGALVWALSGSEKLGSLFRNGGGLAQDLDMIKPSHLADGKHNYFISGIGVTLATAADFLQHWFPKLKPALVPLTFMTDGLGRFFLRKAQLSGELCSTTDTHSKPFNVDHLFDKANDKLKRERPSSRLTLHNFDQEQVEGEMPLQAAA